MNASKGHPGPPHLADGDECEVLAGKHRGKVGTASAIKASPAGEITITVTQRDGTRFKTLARSVRVLSSRG